MGLSIGGGSSSRSDELSGRTMMGSTGFGGGELSDSTTMEIIPVLQRKIPQVLPKRSWKNTAKESKGCVGRARKRDRKH